MEERQRPQNQDLAANESESGSSCGFKDARMSFLMIRFRPRLDRTVSMEAWIMISAGERLLVCGDLLSVTSNTHWLTLANTQQCNRVTGITSLKSHDLVWCACCTIILVCCTPWCTLWCAGSGEINWTRALWPHVVQSSSFIVVISSPSVPPIQPRLFDITSQQSAPCIALLNPPPCDAFKASSILWLRILHQQKCTTKWNTYFRQFIEVWGARAAEYGGMPPRSRSGGT